MLTELRLRRFRRFPEHAISFGRTTVLVGPNNAGKSTVVEALRLVALVVRYSPNLAFGSIPDWVEMPFGTRGTRPGLKDRGFDLRGAIHRLGDPPASLRATFESGACVEVLIGPDQDVVAVIRSPDGASVQNKRQARVLAEEQIAIQPQVAPLIFEEGQRDSDYVRRYEGSARAPQHFRNQLLLADPEEYDAFKQLAETSWPGLQVRDCYREDRRVYLIVRDRDFAGEVSMMGHGLQMWLQTMWFLVRNKDAATIVLDEPDVYMHADLQRGLLRHLRTRHRQVIVATHSVEIMSEVEPDQVVVVDASGPASSPAADLAAVQQVIENMGGVHNLQLTRMWKARRVLLVEGDDLAILERLHATLSPRAAPLGTSPTWSVGGWGGFSYAIGSSMALTNAAGQRIRTYCLLDRDYHLDEEIGGRRETARKRHVELHVWGRKEIENYLLVPEAIARLIDERTRAAKGPSADEIADQIDSAAEGLRDEVQLALVDAHSDFSGGGKGRSRNAAAYANKRIRETYADNAGRIAACPGKTVLRAVRKWAQDTWGVSLSVHSIAAELRGDEIDAEVRDVLHCIECADPLPPDGRGKASAAAS